MIFQYKYKYQDNTGKDIIFLIKIKLAVNPINIYRTCLLKIVYNDVKNTVYSI